MTAFRDGSDFTEKDVFFLTLLQPHFHAAYAANAAIRQATPALTQRQMDIMRLVRAGLSNRQIARRTGLSEGTVDNHLTHIYARLDVQDLRGLRAIFSVSSAGNPRQGKPACACQSVRAAKVLAPPSTRALRRVR